MLQRLWTNGAVLAAVIAATLGCVAWGGDSPQDVQAVDQARMIVSRIGVHRGICVLLDSQPAELAKAIARQSELTVYVQLRTEEAVSAAREQLEAAGVLGTRVYVEKGAWSRIHLADNLADAVIVMPGSAAGVRENRRELLRVVRPLGKVMVGDQETVKPFPAEAGQWTHPYHGPDNNPQSTDQLARAPYLTQFLAEPWYVPFPEVTVTAAGRVFKAFGHVGFKQRDWPWLNTLVAINGYNGTLLWKRPLEEGFNIHRNTMVATPEILYLADSKSCKLLDTATGEPRDEIMAPAGASGPVWKWMALDEGILYALVGEEEFRDETLRGTLASAGWPWTPMTRGYDSRDYRWGFGRTFFAMDPKTKKILWLHNESDPIDGRAVAMKHGRIFYYSEEKFVACLDAKKGKPAWRTADRQLLAAIGPTLHAQRPDWGFNTSCYLKCSDQAIYFAGPQRERLVALSAEDGRLLWTYGHGNFQLVLREQGLYALGRTGASKLFEPLNGQVLHEITALRGNCTRATGTVDAILTRGHNHTGTMRLAVANNEPQRIALMRPDCHDGVIVGNGLLYWGPWMCDCNLSLVGIICLGPAGDFRFQSEANEAERLEKLADVDSPVPLDIAPGDWPAYRADNRRSAGAEVSIPCAVEEAWQFKPAVLGDPAPPITAGGLVYLSGADGVVRALDAASGRVRWKAYTGGPIQYPPAVERGRLFVGSGDGWVYAFEAATGKALWRFRTAPIERKINLYGKLASTWPVASGVVVDKGVVYAAAGIASYDGTHLYALDAGTGRLRWQNNTSGRLAGEGKVTGVSVQGHLLLQGDRLYLAGGNVVSPAVYDIADGKCLSTLSDEWGKAPRGRELFVIDGQVVGFERLLYAPKEYWAGRYFARHFLQSDTADALVRGMEKRIVRVEPRGGENLRDLWEGKRPAWKAVWESKGFEFPAAMVLVKNAVVVAGQTPSADPAKRQYAVAALSLADGKAMWTLTLPDMPVSWGMATDRSGRVVVALEDGRVLCFAGNSGTGT